MVSLLKCIAKKAATIFSLFSFTRQIISVFPKFSLGSAKLAGELWKGEGLTGNRPVESAVQPLLVSWFGCKLCKGRAPG